MKTLTSTIYKPFGSNTVFWFVDFSYNGKLIGSYKFDNHLSCFDLSLQFANEQGFSHVKFFDATVKKPYKIKV